MNSSNEYIIHREEERLLVGWLKQQGAIFHAPLQTVILVSLAIFSLQVGVIWWLTSIADSVFIQAESPNIEDVRLLGLAFVFILLLTKIKNGLVKQTHGRVCSTLQARLQYQMESGNQAMIRNESHYLWQQLWLEKIPAVGDYITKYRIQKKMATVTPFIAVAIIWPINWVIALALLVAIPIVPLTMYMIGRGSMAQLRKHFSALAIALVTIFVGFNLLGNVQLGAHLALHQGLFLLLISPQIFSELKRLGKQYHQKTHAVAAAQHLMPIYEVASPIKRLHQFDGLHWHDVKVESPELQANEIELTPGDWVLLSGESGSGKTILLETLMAQRPASHILNANVALLTQHAVVKPKSLRENLTLGRRVADATLWELLEALELTEWASSLPNGLNSKLDEISALSFGQQQRIAIARMLLSDADIILLDEPTAHLTDEQHLRITQLMRENFKDKTVIWASHKPLNQEWFNRFWHMENLNLSELFPNSF